MARTALLPDLAALAGVPLERAVALLEVTARGARMLGAPLAGPGVALVGALPVLAVAAATFAVCALLVARLVLAAVAGPVEREPQGCWRDLADGLRTAREPLLRAVVLLVLVTNMLDAARTSVLLPVYAERVLDGGAAFGLLVGVMAGDAFAGNLVFGAIGHRLPRRPVFVVCFAMAGGPPSLAMAAGVPLETLVAGLAVEQAGLATLLGTGAAYVLITLSPLLDGPWRGLDRRPGVVATAP